MKRSLIVGITAILSITAVVSTASGSDTPQSSSAMVAGSPKELIDQVWQIINRQYIDATFNGQDWQAVRSEYLSRDYIATAKAVKSLCEAQLPLHPSNS